MKDEGGTTIVAVENRFSAKHPKRRKSKRGAPKGKLDALEPMSAISCHSLPWVVRGWRSGVTAGNPKISFIIARGSAIVCHVEGGGWRAEGGGSRRRMQAEG